MEAIVTLIIVFMFVIMFKEQITTTKENINEIIDNTGYAAKHGTKIVAIQTGKVSHEMTAEARKEYNIPKGMSVLEYFDKEGQHD